MFFIPALQTLLHPRDFDLTFAGIEVSAGCRLLNAKECASVACVQRSWRELSQEDFIWKRLFAEDWNQEQKVSISGGTFLTFRCALDVQPQMLFALSISNTLHVPTSAYILLLSSIL